MFHFLSISNLNSSKGTLVLLKAISQLLDKTADFHVHFVGAPTVEISADQMLQEIETRKLQAVVTYHGKLYGNDKKMRFEEADCFVHPTLNDCFPLVILEAMQHSLPVISTPVGAIPDMVLEGETGTIVPVNSTTALMEAMLQLILHPDKAQELGQKGKLKYEERFTLSHFEENLLSILKS